MTNIENFDSWKLNGFHWQIWKTWELETLSKKYEKIIPNLFWTQLVCGMCIKVSKSLLQKATSSIYNQNLIEYLQTK